MHVSKIESYETAIRHLKFPFKLLCINAVRKNLDRYGGISLAMKFNLKLTFDKETKGKIRHWLGGHFYIQIHYLPFVLY